MDTAEWYLYQQKAEGPFTQKQILVLYNEKKIPDDAYIFRTGWKEWVPLEDCSTELGLELPKSKSSRAKERRNKAPRATIEGKIIVHNEMNLVIGKGVNISTSGIFLETKKPIFKVGDSIKVTCKIKQMKKSFNAKAEVIRYSEKGEGSSGPGFGMRFTELNAKVVQEIQKLIDQQNEGQLLENRS